MDNDVFVYLVFLTDHSDIEPSNTVEGVFTNRQSATSWVIARGALAADIYGNSELLRYADDCWYVIKRVDGVYVKTGQVISIYLRKLQS